MRLNKIYLSLFVLLGSIFPLQAQNNPFKIDDELYAYYVRCTKKVSNDAVLLMADTLFQKAGKKGDFKAQCLSKMLVCDYYYYRKDIPALKEQVKNIRKFAEKTSCQKYIFNSWGRVVSYYLMNNIYDEALNELHEYQLEALRLKDTYGIYNSYKLLGNVYATRGEQRKALQQYQKSISYAIANNETKEISDLYLALGRSFAAMAGDTQLQYRDSAAVYLRKSLETVPEESRKVSIYIRMAILYLDMERFDSVWDCVTHLNELRKHYSLNGATKSNYYYVLSAYYRRTKDFEKALLYSDSIGTEVGVADAKNKIYYDKGDFREAYLWYQDYVFLSNKTRISENDKRLSEMTARFDNQRLASEKDRLALQNSQMRILQLDNERRLLETGRERDTLELKATQLELSNKNLVLTQKEEEASHNHLEILRQTERAESISRQNELKGQIVLILVLVLLGVIAASCAYFIYRRKTIAIIRQERDVALLAQSEAESASRMKSLFLQNMSHEIRTPLNAIVGFTEVLNSEEDLGLEEEERKDMLGLIKTNSDLLTTLINDILDLSRLESGTDKLNLSEVAVSPLCRAALASVEHRARSGVRLRLEEPEGAAQILLRTDSTRLQQVLINFLTNACKYTEKGSITLAYRQRETGEWEFSVTDTGCGIPTDKVETVFERFEKLDSFKQGTGLGLNICRRIADLIGGRVYVDGTYTDGARFVFVHPVIPEK